MDTALLGVELADEACSAGKSDLQGFLGNTERQQKADMVAEAG